MDTNQPSCGSKIIQNENGNRVAAVVNQFRILRRKVLLN